MQISESWLREWVSPSLSSDELAHQITMAGLEVDGIEAAAPAFSGVVVAEVVAVAPHPNADKLRVCQVSDGEDTVQVVCGAPNVREGLRVPFARVGAKLPGDFKIKKAKLRGEASFGMLCGASEIGLEDLIDGLLELPADAPVGTDIREYLSLDDTLIEVDLTPNRGDCLSIRGVAREVAALNDLPFNEPAIEAVPATIDDSKQITLTAPEDCARYLGRVIRQVDVSAPTPLWMVEKLRRGGVRSVDIIVDITNYVLLELGQPLHAFDLAKLQGDIQVRRATQVEKLELLNDQQIELNDDTLVIADEKQAVAMAGVMGGAATAVSAETQDVFVECAWFAPISLAGKARAYGLHTDASHRYERGVDWQLQKNAIERVTQLILKLAGGQAGPVVEAVDQAHLPAASTVAFEPQRANQLLALELDNDSIKAYLQRLGFTVEQNGESWQVTAPSWRFDISYPEDLVEEVARLYGYDRLPSRLPQISTEPQRVSETLLPQRRLVDLLVDRGYNESICYSFSEADRQTLVTPDVVGPTLINPISADMATMRTSLLPGLLTAAAYNLNRQVSKLRLFETGLRFMPSDDGLQQDKMLAGLCYGEAAWQQWDGKGRNIDFYDVKGDVEALLAATSDDASYYFKPAEQAAFHPGQSAAIYRGELLLGYVGRIHPTLAKKFDVSADIYLFELCLDGMATQKLPHFQPLSDQPAVRRDLAFTLAAEVPAATVLDAIRTNAPDALQSLRLFDVYQGEHLDEGIKSLAVGLVFQDAERTLTEVEINDWIDRIVLVLKQEFKAQLRE